MIAQLGVGAAVPLIPAANGVNPGAIDRFGPRDDERDRRIIGGSGASEEQSRQSGQEESRDQSPGASDPAVIIDISGRQADQPTGPVTASNTGSSNNARAGNASNEGADDGAPPSQARESADQAAERAAPEDPFALSDEEKEILRELQRTDAEVRRHEQAHKAVAGPLAGAISYTFQTGPDGQRYAVAGSVPIDTAPVEGDPEATIRKLETVRRAALAPAQPSPADRGIAAAAGQQIQAARAELAAQRAEERAEASAPEDDQATPFPFPAQQPAVTQASFATVSEIYNRNGETQGDAQTDRRPAVLV